MGLLSKQALLTREELEIVKVPLKGADFVFVRQMTGHERDAWEQSLRSKIKDKKGKVVDYQVNLDDFRAKLAVQTLCDEKGNLLLETGDAHTLSQSLSAKSLETIINAAQKINKISKEDKENLVKN